jgi:hypothetical protein
MPKIVHRRGKIKITLQQSNLKVLKMPKIVHRRGKIKIT